MKASVIDINGKKVKEIEISDSVFFIKPNKDTIYESIKNELANKRQGTSSVKTKAEVSGSGTKPWKQKGTGSRARVGTKRNPVWTHGGVAFGPNPRDFSYKLPKKVKNLAYRSIFSLKNSEGNVIIVDKFPLTEGKTKEFLDMINNVVTKNGVNDRVALIVTDNDKLVYRASRNISWIKNLNSARLNIHDLYYSNKLVLTEESVMNIDNNFKVNEA
ncbi:MAG TPA: 50S ribosomal protein L4 [Spirochaetota bacterium]|jgi:large subunit ribosomal protein L4|nr:MAG: 50S ribosomal protein L4 [Spirochaetes bacterium ADurb.Bin133]HPY87071.1 50S ribosomal protein L4 [Spirochaetota bacterium]